MAKDPALERRKLELQYQFRFRIVDLFSQLIDKGLPIVGLFVFSYYGLFRTVHDLAGKQTTTSFGLALLADVRPSELVSYAFGLLGWIFGLNAQRLRRNVTERLTGRLAELERKYDPARSTSGLTTRGKTPPEK